MKPQVISVDIINEALLFATLKNASVILVRNLDASKTPPKVKAQITNHIVPNIPLIPFVRMRELSNGFFISRLTDP